MNLRVWIGRSFFVIAGGLSFVVCHADSTKIVGSKTSLPMVLCGQTLTPYMATFVAPVQRKFGQIQCGHERNKGYVSGIRRDSKLPGINIPPEDPHNLPSHFHELLHLWLGTQGWDLNANGEHCRSGQIKNKKSLAALCAEFDHYLEHLRFQPEIKESGISLKEDARKFVATSEQRLNDPKSSFIPVEIAVAYLQNSLYDPEAGQEFRQFLSHKSWGGIVLDAAASFQRTIDWNDHKTQAAAYKTVQDCIDAVFQQDGRSVVPIHGGP